VTPRPLGSRPLAKKRPATSLRAIRPPENRPHARRRRWQLPRVKPPPVTPPPLVKKLFAKKPHATPLLENRPPKRRRHATRRHGWQTPVPPPLEQALLDAAARSRVTANAPDDDLAEFVAGIEDAALMDEDALSARSPGASPPAAEPVTQPEWKQLLTAIKRDIAHLRTEHPEAAPAKQRSPKPSPKTGRSRATGAKTRVKVSKPLQDEWGFFDPERCGFAALLTKLDAVTDAGFTRAKETGQATSLGGDDRPWGERAARLRTYAGSRRRPSP
jgi:hypothetical protein